MTFGNLWPLVLLPLPLLWMGLRWRHTETRTGLVLKAMMLAAVILALTEPLLPVWETKVAVTILADTSASVTDADLKRASEIVAGIEARKGRHWTRIIPFARNPRAPAAEEVAGSIQLRHTGGEAGRATDLEGAIRTAIGAAPPGLAPRIVLISDGKENRGNALRAAWQAARLGVPIDTYVLPGRPRPELRLESVSMPSVAFSGERFPIELHVASPREVEATVSVAAEGKELGETHVSLRSGMNTVRITASVAVAGAVELSGAVRASELGEVRFAQALTLRKPRVLFVSQDPPETEADLLEVLAASQFEVKRAAELEDENLAGYQVVVLNNWDLEGIAPARKADIEDFVQQGGGLLVIGGERNVYVEQKGIEDALDRVLPAKLAPPRSPEGTCVVLIIDKSSSMEGRKMELARLAAIGVVDNLRPIDLVGVLIFDNSNQWAVPIRRAEDRPLIKRLIAGITPDGGTQIAPALAEAYRRILPAPATFKHIVLLTDGISEEGDSLSLAKEAALQRVTISTVGLGQDVNRAYLERVAALAKGKSYFLNDPSMLEQILLRDVMEHTGSTAVEKPLRPIVAKDAEILSGVGMESAPPLKGYVRFIAKPSAETLLLMERKDPLLTRWQYGLGRAAVFTSDAKSRWAADWVNWEGFDRFWANVFRDLLPRSQPGEATLRFDRASGRLEITYRLSRSMAEPARAPDIFALGPDGFRQPVPIRKAAAGVYSGSIEIGERKGLFRIRPVEETRAFPETGYYRQEEELNDYGSNPALLREIANYTGGRFEPRVEEVFASDGRAVASEMSLWPGLLAVALLLNLAELIHRKRKGLREVFLRRAASEGASAA
jgi:Ca-activated chloride channel family protein